MSAIPTFLLVWLLYFYVSRVLFGPLEKTMRERHQVTAGRREAAEKSLTVAEQKTAEYTAALRAARTELYRQQEQERQQALEQRAEAIRQARKEAGEMIAQTRRELGKEVEEAKKRLGAESEALAQAIQRTILEPGTGLASPNVASGSEASR
ncbi:MAG: ATP synthase F0 subunit B [Acidobacteria bacterium]|nr:ATP synthase F0 subunit B [Acidobacteriota bacterium]